MKNLCFISVIILFYLFACNNPSPEQSQKEDWVSLFNGKDLAGWDIKIAGHEINDNYLNTFRVEDSMLRISYDDYKQFDEKYGHLYYQKPYSWYKIRFKYRFTGEQLKGGATWNVRNSGVMVHSQSAQSNGIDQHFPVSIEVQLLGGLGTEKRQTANLCTPGTRVEMDGKIRYDHCINSDSKTYHGDQWISAEAIVLGDSVIHHLVEGDTVLTYYKPQIDGVFISKNNSWEESFVPDGEAWSKREGELLTEGYIALQAESHPIDFRKIELLDLEGCTDPKAQNYKPYYQKSANERCRY